MLGRRQELTLSAHHYIHDKEATLSVSLSSPSPSSIIIIINQSSINQTINLNQSTNHQSYNH